MVFRKTLFVLFALVFFLGCGKSEEPKKEAGQGDSHAEEAGQHEGERPGVIALSPEAVESAGIKTEALSLRPVNVEYSFTGKVSVNETRLAHVGPRIPGRAVEVLANAGDYVKKGQPLAIIDSPELGESQSQYLKAKTAYEIADKSFERAKIVLEGKVISTGEFQRREGEYLSAKTELKAAEDKSWEIDLLLTDVIMPGGSGPEVAKHLRRRCPDLKILFMSGYTGTALAHQWILESGSPLLQKPYSPGGLWQKVREVLDHPQRKKP